MSELETQAHAITNRVDADVVGFDPITILGIITQVLPLLIQCFNSAAAFDDPNAINARLREAHEQNPQALLRKTARRIRAEADHPMSKKASFEMAQAVIDQALETSDATAIACCAEAGI